MRSFLIRMLIAAVATLALLVLPQCVMATELVVHLVSDHKGGDPNTRYNNQNVGLGVVTQEGNLAGVYYNSYKTWSPYLGKEWLYKDTVGGWLGIAFNYKEVSRTGVLLIGGLTVKVRTAATGDTALKITAVPRSGDNPQVVHLMLVHKF